MKAPKKPKKSAGNVAKQNYLKRLAEFNKKQTERKSLDKKIWG